MVSVSTAAAPELVITPEFVPPSERDLTATL